MFKLQVCLTPSISKRYWQSFSFSTPGPHVFLIVIPLGRCTQEKETVKILNTILSEQAEKCAMVLFTYGHLLGEKSIEDYVKGDLYLQKIVGYHVFNNENHSQVIELLRKIAR